MLISSQTSYCLGNTMDTFKSNTAKGVKNVARKSTSNRPLKTINNKSAVRTDISGLYSKNVNKVLESGRNYSAINVENTKYNYMSNSPSVDNYSFDCLPSNYSFDRQSPLPPNYSLDCQSPENVSDEECEIDGVFSISSSMMQYLKESQLSPTILYDSDEAVDPAGVLNYPVKYEFPSFANKEFVPIYTEELPTEDNSDASEADEIQIDECCSTSDNVEMEPVKPLINKQKIIKDTFCNVDKKSSDIINDNKALIRVSEEVDNDNKSATIISADEVTSSENVSSFENNSENGIRIEFTTTCHTLWQDLSPIEESAQDQNITQNISHPSAVKSGKVKKPRKKASLTLGKKKNRKTKKELLNKIIEESVPNGKRTQATRKRNQTKIPTPPRPKRKRPFSNRLSKANLNLAEDVSEHSDLDIDTNSITNEYNSETEECKSGKEKGSYIDNKKDTTKCEKRKKEINEGILLHVEAAKKTDIMRDGKLLKDKKDLLKGLDATIDENLPVEVDKKDFEIQQSLAEEILLDQALRLAHQRTSPRRRPLLTTSEAKELVNSLTSQNNKRKQSNKIKSNSLESPEKQTPSSDRNSSDSESDSEQKQNVNTEDQVNKTDASSNLKNHKKKSSRSKQIDDIKKILKQMANKLDPSKVDISNLSKTVEDALKNINTLRKFSSDELSESDKQEEKLKSNPQKKRKKSKSSRNESGKVLFQNQSRYCTDESESDEENQNGSPKPKKKRKGSNSNVSVGKALLQKESITNFSSADQSEVDKEMKYTSKRVTRGSKAKVNADKDSSTKKSVNNFSSDSESESDTQDSTVNSPPKRITRSKSNVSTKTTVRRALRSRESITNNLSSTDESEDSIPTRIKRNTRSNVRKEAPTGKVQTPNDSVTDLTSADPSESEIAENNEVKSYPKRKTKSTISNITEETTIDKYLVPRESVTNLSNAVQSESDAEEINIKSYPKRKTRKSISHLNAETTTNEDLTPKESLTQIHSIDHYESDTQVDEIKSYPKRKTRKSKSTNVVDDGISFDMDLSPKESLLSMNDSEELVPVIIIKNKNEAFLRRRSHRVSKPISDKDECEVTSTSDDKVATPDQIENKNEKQSEINLIYLDVSYGSDTLIIDEKTDNNQSTIIENNVDQPNIIMDKTARRPTIIDDKDADHTTILGNKDTDQPTIIDNKDADQLTIIEDRDEDQLTKIVDKDADQHIIIKDKDADKPTIVEDKDADKPTIIKDDDADQLTIIENSDAGPPTIIEDDSADKLAILADKDADQPTIIKDDDAAQLTIIDKDVIDNSSFPQSTIGEVSNSQNETSDGVNAEESPINIEDSPASPDDISNEPKPNMEEIIDIIDVDMDIETLEDNNEIEITHVEENIPFLNDTTIKYTQNDSLINDTVLSINNVNNNLTNITPKKYNNMPVSSSSLFYPATSEINTTGFKELLGNIQIEPGTSQSSMLNTSSTVLGNSVPKAPSLPSITEISCVTPSLLQSHSVGTNHNDSLCSTSTVSPHVFPQNITGYSTTSSQITTSIISTSTLLQHISQQNLSSHCINTSEAQTSNYLNRNQSNFQCPIPTSSHYSPATEISESGLKSTTVELSNELKSVASPAQEEPKPKPKVVDVPLSILARDPRLRRKTVRIFLDDVEYSAPRAKEPINNPGDSKALVPFSRALVPSRTPGDSRAFVSPRATASSRVSLDSKTLVPFSSAVVPSRVSGDSRSLVPLNSAIIPSGVSGDSRSLVPLSSAVVPSRVSVDSRSLVALSSATVPSRVSGEPRSSVSTNVTVPSRVSSDQRMSGDLRLLSASRTPAAPISSDVNPLEQVDGIRQEDSNNDSDTSNDVDPDSLIPDSLKKKQKKKEIDLELLYKTPLSDLHEETSERSSYARKPQRLPPRCESVRQTVKVARQTEVKVARQAEVKVACPTEVKVQERSLESFNHHEPYREYNTNSTNPNYRNTSSFNHSHEVTSEYPPAFHTNYKKPNPLRAEGHHREEYPQHSRRSDHYPRRRTEEYEDEKRREQTDRRPALEQQSFARSNHRTREYSPDQTDYKHRRKSNDYTRWDYAHKKVDGKFPAQANSESNSNEVAWKDTESRDLLEGPIQSSNRPFYRRRNFSRSGGYKSGYSQEEDELFERRWDGSEDDRRYKRPFRDRSPYHPRVKRVDRPHGPGRGAEQESPMSPDQEPFVYKEPSKYLPIPQ